MVCHLLETQTVDFPYDDEVIVLTEATSAESFDLFNEENITKLQAMPQKNIAMNIVMCMMKEKLQDVKKDKHHRK